jgi:hypothetical protein
MNAKGNKDDIKSAAIHQEIENSIHFTCIIYPDYCGIFCGNNNRHNRGVPIYFKWLSKLTV